MKRAHKIIACLSLIATIWLWSRNQLSFELWISFPITLAVLLAIYAAVDILGSIAKIKAYP